MHEVIWKCCWQSLTVQHEMGHNMGAVQHSAPRSTATWHCTDGIDVMCNSQGTISYSESTCPESSFIYFFPYFLPSFDCQYNDYFNANPNVGGYLATHWNIGRAYNGVLTGGG